MIRPQTRLRKVLTRDPVMPALTLAVLFCAFMVSASSRRVNVVAKTVGLAVLSPAQWGTQRIARRLAGAMSWARSVRDLERENALLREQVEALYLELHGLREAAYENDALRGLLDCRRRLPLKTVSAHRPPAKSFRPFVNARLP